MGATVLYTFSILSVLISYIFQKVLHILTTDPASNRPLYLLYPVSIIFVQDPKDAAYTDYRPIEQHSSMPSLLYTFSIHLVSFLYKIQKVLHTQTTDPARNSPLNLPYPLSIIFVQDQKGAAYSYYIPREKQSSIPSLSS